MSNGGRGEDDAARCEARRKLLAAIGEIKAFQKKHRKTNGELYGDCFSRPNTARVGFERFEDVLNETKLPKTLTAMRETTASLRTGLARAEAAHDPDHCLYEALANKAGRGDAAREGFDLFLGKYHFCRLGPGDALVRGTLEFYCHETGLNPYHRQEHQQEIDGNIHNFIYEGPVLMMPRNVLLLGFRASEVRMTDLLRTDPRKEYLSGKFLTQKHRSYEPFGGDIVLYKDDLWQRSLPTDEFLANLLHNAHSP